MRIHVDRHSQHDGAAGATPRRQWRIALAALLASTMLAGTGAPAALAAGSYSRLQVLLPGESAAPGTASGKTGTPLAQTSGVPFSITVRACDSNWNLVNTVTDAIQTLSSDASASLPPPTQLANGAATLTVTFNAGGTFTVYGHDQTDGTIPDGASSPVTSLVLQGFTFQRITQKNQSAGVSMPTVVTAVDPGGATVRGFSGVVRLKEITSFGDGRVSPDSVALSGGTWSGNVTMYRADETSINRGNVNLYAYLSAAPAKNGTSDPFTVHPGVFARVQVVVPGQNPLPGSIAGVTGTPATQNAAHAFPVTVNATDTWWNPLFSGDNVRLTSSDPAANVPLSGLLSNGTAQFSVILGTVGTQTLTVSDVTNPSITAMTSLGIQVIPNAVDHFVVNAIASPQIAGNPVTVTIRATDASGNTVPGYSSSAVLLANTGPGSISPEAITFTNGTWTGPLTYFGAGGAVSFTCSDFSSPPHTGTSNSISVQPGPLAGLQILLPGETALGGTASGKSGTPTSHAAGAAFSVTVRAVDAYWNLVPGIGHHVALASSDSFATMPADTALANGQIVFPATLYKSGPQRIWVSDVDVPATKPDTSAYVTIVGGPFARVLILAPGESPAPGTLTGRTGTPTDESINYAFDVTILATDSWWNPVTGVNDVVHVTSDDPLAVLPADTAMVNGRIQAPIRLARGGYDLLSVADVTRPAIGGSSTQVKAISSGFHLEASVSPSSAPAGGPFTLTVRVTNDAGSTIQEINSFVTVEVQNASSRAPGRGTLLTTQFQLLQGTRSVSEAYTFAEPIVVVARDDAGNAPATSNSIVITPGAPTAIRFTSSPAWVGGNHHATLDARLVDAYDNGVPGVAMVFQHLSGTGTLTPIDSLSDSTGLARADFLSPREPELDQFRVSAGAIVANLAVQTAFVDPNAAGGTVTNYPNPFHPPAEGTTIAYKLSDDAHVTLRIFTDQGDLVLRQTFSSGAVGGRGGLNQFVWDGRNGEGRAVASGGYLALIEAERNGATLNVMRRKIAVVR